MNNRTAAFFIGYGVTMAVVLLAVRLRHRSRRGTFKRALSYMRISGGRPAPDSPGMTRHATSDMGALVQPPRNKQSRRLGYWTMNRKVVLVMVGLPARGKSYIVKMLIRYLNWIGFPTRVFNIGDYRRKLGYGGVSKSFFDKDNEEGMKIRQKMVQVVQDDMYKWLQQDDEAKVALFDATNTTKDRRALLMQRAREEKNCMLVFIESICDDPEILAQNYKLKLRNDDYKAMDPHQALRDFKERVKAYEAVYETIEDNEDGGQIQYIKLYNVGQKVVTRNCKGYLPSQVAFYLQNVHIGARKIWLTRPAESVSTAVGEISDVGELTEAGRQYSMTVAKFLRLEQENMSTTMSITGAGREILVMAGTQKADTESIAHLQMLYPVATTPLLNELRGGHFAHMRRDEFKERHPDLFAEREADKLDFRYPGAGGESYMDVIQRVRPIIVELERQPRSIVVVCHLAVQRCLYAYFMGVAVKDVPHIELPMHTITELIPTPFGTSARHIPQAEMADS